MTRNLLSGRRCAGWPLAVLLAASVAACGGGDDDAGGGPVTDPLAVYREQTVAWSACDETILGPEDRAGGERFTQYVKELAGRLQCAHVRAPMDWSQPSRGDVYVAVMRLSSSDGAQRRGSILFNPGGPGGDGLGSWLALFRAFSLSNPDSAQGAQQLKLMATYDLVGFSPRGTGASTRNHCVTNEIARVVDSSPEGTTDANLANASYNAQRLAEACWRNPITPYINTDATARDMDLIRGLLGDEKLNYVGYSYGTWLGSWYAGLFPEKVGRMVLDSSEDFSSPIEKALIAKPRARQLIEDEVLLPYAVRHPAYFGLGTSEAEIRQMLSGLLPGLQGLLGNTLAGTSYSVAAVDDSLGLMLAAKGLNEVLTSTDPQDDDAVEDALNAYTFLPGAAQRNADVRQAATELYHAYYRMKYETRPTSIQADGTFWSVHCNDSTATTDPVAWAAIVREQASSSPFYYGVLLENVCTYWGGPRVRKPGLEVLKDLDILMVQSQYDGATPTPDADHYFTQLAGAHRIYVPGEYQHGVFPYKDDCVDVHTVAYLLGESPRQRQIDCRANPLPQDAAKAKAQGRATPASAASAPTYTHPEEAGRLIDEFKRVLVPRGAPR